MWLAINHVDSRARDYPLVRIKYALLLLLAPLLVASGWVELQYFLGLKADVITSCCGSLFSEGSPTLAAEASALPPLPAMWLFYGSLGAAIVVAAWHGYGGGRSGWSAYALATASAIGFAATIAGILSFVSLYIYEHPNHHCPFCILKPEYGYQGYWLYVPLFGATAAGLAVGAVQPFARIESLRDIVPGFSRTLAAIAANGFALTAAIATAMIWQSRLILLEY
jgi:predicted small integral membrane protein